MFPSACLFLCLASSAVFGQTDASAISFEAAEVKVNKSGGPGILFQFLPGGQLRATNAPMWLLISQAYDLHPDLLSGGPDWMGSDRFDVIAKSRPDADEKELRRMLQTLLAERFKLAVHREEKVRTVYTLTVGKGGAKLKASQPGKPWERRCSPADGAPEQLHLVCPNMSMAELADGLPDIAPRYITMPVMDRTGLQGSFEVKLDWTPMAAPPGAGSDAGPTIETAGGLTIFDAVARLGLKLERAKLPVQVIAIDRVERAPVEN
jgi:uncharacterized protein (TIGR03435 family)